MQNEKSHKRKKNHIQRVSLQIKITKKMIVLWFPIKKGDADISPKFWQILTNQIKDWWKWIASQE